MAYLGDIRLGDTIDFHFTTRQISGAPSTLSSSPVLSCYPANSTTEITAGITLDVDFDSRTGLNHVRIVASNGNGYATATDYSVVITTGTVNSVSVVGEVIGNFSIEHRSALMPATAARTLVVDAAGLGDANMVKMGPSGSGTAQTARDIGASVLLSNGTGTGQISLVSGAVLLQATQTGVTIPTVTNLTNAPTNGDFTATMKTSIGTAVAASAVASVTGSVGSVVAGVTVTTNNDKSGYLLTAAYDAAKTAAQAGDSMALTTAAQQAAADTLLGRNVAGGSSSGRTVKQALYVLRNKVDTVAGNVYQTDDSTVEWIFTVTQTAGNPITQIDPA